ncbi:hypothetical protein AJ80_03767 [Polytolypa hystricis UAMH7299]|uniref:Small ribosomal subunit protein mS37 n=1 Tax=Polytolypa hystricis (strain UAMH7299) TaxID=1447883 RepID=A0A2B7YF83_POLH7|nr:hypothetical protein AJ80_03767 [Polytolypa hystricis UAMH7299]
MPPRGISTRMKPMQLQTVNKLRVKRPNKSEPNPCTAVMSSVLTCWASSRFSVEGCFQVEQQLRACVDAKSTKTTHKSTINYHLMRMFPKMSGPRKPRQ